MDWERSCILASAVGIDAAPARAVHRLREGAPPVRPADRQVPGRVAPDRRHEAPARDRRLLLYRLGWLKRDGKPAPLDSALVKLHLSESFLQSSLDALQIHGGYGYLTESELEREVRDAVAGRIYSGTSDIQRNLVAAPPRAVGGNDGRICFTTCSSARPRSHPDRTAVEDGDRSLTYAELEARSNQVANLLLDLGVAEGDRVGLYLDKSHRVGRRDLRRPEGGAAYVPLDPRAPAARLALHRAATAASGSCSAAPRRPSRGPSSWTHGAPLEAIVVANATDLGPDEPSRRHSS